MSHDPNLFKLGSEIFADNLAKKIAKLGHEVHVFRGFSNEDKELSEDQVIIHNFHNSSINFLGSLQLIIKMKNKLKILQKKRNFDWFILIGGGVGFIAPFLRGKNVCFYVIDFSVSEYNALKSGKVGILQYSFYKALAIGEYLAITYSKVIFLITTDQFEEFQSKFPSKLKNVYILPLGLSDIWYNTHNTFYNIKQIRNPCLIFFGAGKRRNPQLFLKILEYLEQKHFEIEGIMIRESKSYIDEIFDTKKIKLTILNNLSQEEIIKLYGRCIALIMPTYREGFCLPIIEAGSQYVITVASYIPQFRDLIDDGKTGILINSNDLTDWIKPIERLLLDNEQLMSLRKAARTKSENFNLNLITEKLIAHLIEVM